jgi:hypothetical protein
LGSLSLFLTYFFFSFLFSFQATAEPPMIASSSAYFALKMAVNSARRDAGVNSEFELKVPCTVDIRQQACLTNSSQRLVLPY